jgi:glucan phosphoethanolaminetransferase (alkaline phosphatase superfamily)
VGLTSSLFSWLTILLGLAAIVLTIWLWPRLASRKVGTIASRVGLILLCQLLALLMHLGMTWLAELAVIRSPLPFHPQ